MPILRPCICVVGVLVGLAATSLVSASDRACATDKLKDENFQDALSRDHDGVVVRLDVDTDAYLKSARENPDLSEGRRQELLAEGAALLLKAKSGLLQGTRFSIHRNLDLGSEVVVLVDGMEDVCELAANPHVGAIWVNRRWKVEPLRRPEP